MPRKNISIHRCKMSEIIDAKKKTKQSPGKIKPQTPIPRAQNKF